MPPVGFERTISAGERPKTYALDRAATGIGKVSPDYVFRDFFEDNSGLEFRQGRDGYHRNFVRLILRFDLWIFFSSVRHLCFII